LSIRREGKNITGDFLRLNEKGMSTGRATPDKTGLPIPYTTGSLSMELNDFGQTRETFQC